MKITKAAAVEEALAYFGEGYACSQAVLLPFIDEFGLNKKHATAISSTFGGGIGRMGRTCGAVTGAFMVLGLKFGGDSGEIGQRLGAYRKVRELNKKIETEFGSSICKEILSLAKNNSIEQNKPHQKTCDNCVEIATRYVYDMIDC